MPVMMSFTTQAFPFLGFGIVVLRAGHTGVQSFVTERELRVQIRIGHAKFDYPLTQEMLCP
jgi:hypothetical protein